MNKWTYCLLAYYHRLYRDKVKKEYFPLGWKKQSWSWFWETDTSEMKNEAIIQTSMRSCNESVVTEFENNEE